MGCAALLVMPSWEVWVLATEEYVEQRQETSKNDQDKITLLKDEYLFLQKAYEDFDARVMTIKGWSSTVAIAAIGFGFHQGPFLWAFAAGASFLFWLLDATWKVYQHNFRLRIKKLEEAFRDSQFSDIAPFQIYTSWQDAQDEAKKRTWGLSFLTTLFLPIVLFPHFITLVVGILLFSLFCWGSYDCWGQLYVPFSK